MMNSVAQRPDADPDRLILIAAQSGGVAGVALAARNPRGLVGVINISGGLRSESRCPMNDILVDAFRSYGTKSRVPNLWIYAKTDQVFTHDLADRMHAAFLDGGGDVKFVLFNRYFGPDHFPGLRWQWLMQIDAFLRSRQLPTWKADMADVATKLRIPQSREGQRLIKNIVDSYFPAGGEKAVAWPAAALAARTMPKSFGWATGATTLELARQSALKDCQATTGVPCIVVLENFNWVSGPP